MVWAGRGGSGRLQSRRWAAQRPAAGPFYAVFVLSFIIVKPQVDKWSVCMEPSRAELRLCWVLSFRSGLVRLASLLLLLSLQEEISDIKAEGNLEAVLNALDAIVEEGRDRKEPAW